MTCTVCGFDAAGAYRHPHAGRCLEKALEEIARLRLLVDSVQPPHKSDPSVLVDDTLRGAGAAEVPPADSGANNDDKVPPRIRKRNQAH